jgi:hypothetical protein
MLQIDLSPALKEYLTHLIKQSNRQIIDELKVEMAKEKSTLSPEKYLTKNEAACKMCCSLPTLDRRIEEGLPYRKNGKKLLFTDIEIEVFMEKMRQRQAEAIKPKIRDT